MTKSNIDTEFKEKNDNRLNGFHKPVLLKEIIEYLKVKSGKKYIDATLGGGGYSFEIVKQGGKVLGIDLDWDAINYVRSKIKDQKSNIIFGEDLILAQGNFRNLDKIAHLNKLEGVSGIVFDLGLSSYQIEKSGRGFSFLRDEPLDMRMDQSPGSNNLRAFNIVNTWTKEELCELFSKMGEERFAGAISDNIISFRKIDPIRSSLQLSEIVKESIQKTGKTHPATKVFQAVRIAVNDETTNLKEGIAKSFEILENGGRLVIVSFHSLEDRIVKNTFREFEKLHKAVVVTKKPVKASIEEIHKNPRSRSGKLRAIEKVIN